MEAPKPLQMVAFMGERQSGKDYLAAHLAKKYGVRRLSFSDEVRRLAQKMFPWMDFDYPPELKDQPLDHPENPKAWTPRQLWLHAGKVRDIDGAYFVRRFAENQLPAAREVGGIQVITDFRTPEEWEFLKENRVPVIKILCDRTNIEDHPFEEYTRQFQNQTASFYNNKTGTEGFDVFWAWFAKKHL